MPAAGAGTSASTLSVEISTSVSSAATASPGCLGPLEHDALGDRLAHGGHGDVDGAAGALRRRRRRPRRRRPLGRRGRRLAAAPGAVGRRAVVGAISASTAPTVDGVALGGVDLDDGAGDRRGDLGVDLVGGDLDEGLVGRDGVALRLVPFQDGALADRVTHRRHDDFDRRRVHCHRNRLRPYRVVAGPRRRSSTTKPALPANGPTPPMTATITPSQSGITRRRTASMHEQRHDDPADAVAQPKHELGARQARHEPDGEQRQVDRRVGEGEVLERAEAHARASSSGGHPAQRRRRPPAGHGAGSAGHQACASCSWSRVDLGARRPARPGRPASPSGSAGTTSASTASRSGHDGPLLLELARERARRGPRRPRPRRPRRAPSGRPRSPPRRRGGRRASGRRPTRTTHSTESAPSASSPARRSDQRIGCSSTREARARRRGSRRARAARPS